MEDPHDLNPRFHRDGGLRARIEWLYGPAIAETDVRRPSQSRKPLPEAPANLREELPRTPTRAPRPPARSGAERQAAYRERQRLKRAGR
jgi:hypothetical protein